MKILCYLFAVLICSAAHAKPAWHTFKTVAGKSSESIGGYSKGCLLGADELEESGIGFETIRRHRKRFYGHKRLTDFIRDYGRRIEAEGLPPVLIGDLSQIRGGRMNFGHRSHQIGLDADVWFSAPAKAKRKSDKGFPSMVQLETEKIDRKYWSPQKMKLLELAAKDKRVARIFVHWVIKNELCKQKFGDRSWLAKIRPWWGHSSHFHIRLRCSKSDSDCVNQSMIGTADGCGFERWFSKKAVRARKRAKTKPASKKKRSPKPLHARCRALLEDGSKVPWKNR